MKKTKEWKDLPAGVLTDVDIERVSNMLFASNYESSNAKQSHYECVIGEEIVWPRKPEATRKQKLSEGESFYLRPSDTVIVVTRERFRIPDDCVARFLLKGKYFTIGIAPVNTYADPGFVGEMGIVLSNISQNYLRFSRGDIVAKVEFEKLPRSVASPYSGQHGYGTKIWLVAAEFIATEEELKRNGIQSRSVCEIERSYGERVAELKEQLNYYTKIIWWQLAIVAMVMVILLWVFKDLGAGVAIICGIAANVITGFAISGLPKLISWRNMSSSK